MEIIYLMICVVGMGLPEGDTICRTYSLRPQYEMTQEIIAGKIKYICHIAEESAIEFGGHIIKCEVVGNKRTYQDANLPIS